RERNMTTVSADRGDVGAGRKGRATIVYQRHGDRLGMALSVNRVVDLSTGNHYAESVASVDNSEMDRLEQLIDQLLDERDKRTSARDDLATTKTKLDSQHGDLQASVDKASADIDKLGGVPVLGPPTLTGPELAAWF